MRYTRLEDWLSWQEGLNPKTIDLGLKRTMQVWRRLASAGLVSGAVISIAGTNGKGSTVALFEAILKQAGCRTGSYTSPHLLRYNERIRLDGEPVPDQVIVDAFQAIDDARGDIPLTYFEFGTLAALHIFAREKPDVVLLEVGLGGRLDAVNIIDADLAIITSIDIDHQEWLGSDRETIGREKAGIFRQGRPAVFSGRDMPASVADHAAKLQVPLYLNGRDYHYEKIGESWCWRGSDRVVSGLPFPNLRGGHQLDNASGVIMALELLTGNIPVNKAAIEAGLKAINLAGRQQIMEKQGVQWVLDVAHNPHAVAALKNRLQDTPVPGRTLAVLGMLKDKDVVAVLDLMRNQIDKWHFATIDDSRGLSAESLAAMAGKMPSVLMMENHANVKQAVDAAAAEAKSGDRVVVFGSFFTVGEALPMLVV